MTQNETPDPRTGMRPWLKAVLAVSLMLNLAVVGLILGARFGDHDKDHRRGPPRVERSAVDPALGPFARSLPDEARRRAMDELRAQTGDLNMNRAAIAGQLRDMIGLLKADDFDAEAFSALMDTQRAVFDKRAQIGREVVLREIEAMSPEERAAVAERLERGFRRAIERTKP